MKGATPLVYWSFMLTMVLVCGCQGEGCGTQGFRLGGDYEFPRTQALENALTLYLSEEGIQVLQEQAIEIAATMLEQPDYRFDLSDMVAQYLAENPIMLFDFSVRDVHLVAYLPDGTGTVELTVLPDPTRILVQISRLWISVRATVYDDAGSVTSACRIAPGADVGADQLYSVVLQDTQFEIVLDTTSSGELALSSELIDLGLVEDGLGVVIVTDEEDPDYYCNLEECLDGCGECHIFCTGMQLLIDVGEFFVMLIEDLLDDILEIILNVLLEQLQVVQGQMHPALVAGTAVPTLYDANWLGFLLGPGEDGFQAVPIEGVPTSVANELLLSLAAGIESSAHPCIGKDSVDPIWSPPAPLDLELTDIEPHLVLALADTLIDQVVWGAYKSGSLCLLLESGLISRFTDRFQLSAGLLSLLLPGLDRIAERDAPLLISIQPLLQAGDFPLVELRRDQDGETLFGFGLDAVDVGFYAWVQGRYLNLFQVRTAVSLEAVPAILPDNRLQIGISDIHATLLEERYNELFGGVNLVDLVNFALELATATLIESGEGITLSITDLVQELTGLPIVPLVLRLRAAPGNERWLELALRLESPDTGTSARRLVDTELGVLGVHPGTVDVLVTAPGFAPEQIEYQVRWGFGGWSDFKPGGPGILRSTFLLFPGDQTIEVRARAVGDYRSLDPTPAIAVLHVPPWPPTRPGSDPASLSPARPGLESSRSTGCGTVPACHRLHWMWILFGLAGTRRLRWSRTARAAGSR